MRVPRTRRAASFALFAAAFLLSAPNAAYGQLNSAARSTDRPGQAGAQAAGFCAINSCFHFENRHGRILAVLGGQMYNGASAVQWTNTGKADQIWLMDPRGDGAFRIRNSATDGANNDYCLDVKDGSQSWAAKVQVWTCNLNPQQFWHWGLPSPTGGEYSELINNNSGLLLAVWGDTDEIGGSVIQYGRKGSRDQHWRTY